MSAPSSLVPKPWGAEYLAFGDANVAIWYLHLKAGEATSFHLHERKLTFLVVLSGWVRVNGRLLTEGGHFAIRRGEVHGTKAETDAWLIEIECPNDKEDLVRLADVYGREGKPYEAKRVPINGYEYPSKEFP